MANVDCLRQCSVTESTTANRATTRTDCARPTDRPTVGCYGEVFRRLQCNMTFTTTESNVEGISADELQLSLTRSSVAVIIVDCRTFISFNMNHITGAFNAACGDRFSRKRLLEGRASIGDLVSGGPDSGTDGNAKEAYRNLVNRAEMERDSLIVTYDDDTENISILPTTHPLRLLTNSLRTTTKLTVKYLQGGLRNFHSMYSTLCSKPHEPPSRPFLYSPTTPVVELDVDSTDMSQILPYLYIGNERDAANHETLQKEAISHIINVTSHIPQSFEHNDRFNIKYQRIPASDNCSQNLKQYFEQIIEFIELARVSGGRVLVHCQAGVSRSPTIVLAYIIARYNFSLFDAFAFVKSRRPIVAPNFNFLGQLLDFEQQCKCGDIKVALLTDDSLAPIQL